MSFTERQREVVVVLITALFAAFFVNCLSTIVFYEFYSKHSTEFLVAALALLLVASALLYSVLASSSKRSLTIVSIPITFHHPAKRFVDLPHCPLSVHMRANFNRLPDAGREHLSLYSKQIEFWESEFQRFVDQVVQEFVFAIVLHQIEFYDKGYTEVDLKKVPHSIRDNRYLLEWIGKDKSYRLFIPCFRSITGYGRNGAFIRILTDVAKIEFSWTYAHCGQPTYSKYFLNYQDKKELENYSDIEVRISSKSQASPWKLLSRKTNMHTEWSSLINKVLKANDWKSSEIERLYEVIRRAQTGSGPDDDRSIMTISDGI